ncbi:NUDIX hydrolase [Plantibacter sp. M259]|uniref:NUDIX hydrolase n=1 Tax=Plantibacter sp. M259 TaxID=2583822 RepID=UPI00111093F9|nr:NUDIX hydrolase [Plantibacter sp. M259]
MNEDEALVHVTHDAPWLPPGGRAEVVRRTTPPRPMAVVRLLLCDSDRVFCVPRQETGRLDLPMLEAASDDVDGTATIRELAQSITGEAIGVRFIGAVRNVVEAPADGYDWPAPVAHFGVWASDATPKAHGTWVRLDDDEHQLRDRHWYPLVN